LWSCCKGRYDSLGCQRDPDASAEIMAAPGPAPVVGSVDVLLNRAGVIMKPGKGKCIDIWYCGRELGVKAIPGSDGVCGPGNGPQCQDCQHPQSRNYHPGAIGAKPNGVSRCNNESIMWQSDTEKSKKGYDWLNHRLGWQISSRRKSLQDELDTVYGACRLSLRA
jgi:hypothetical protein